MHFERLVCFVPSTKELFPSYLTFRYAFRRLRDPNQARAGNFAARADECVVQGDSVASGH